MRLSFILSILAFTISTFAAFSFFGEYRAARLSLASKTTLFQTLLESPPSRPGSLYADKKIFLACHDTLTGRAAKLQPETALKRISEYCMEQARKALKSSPSSTHAHYVFALAAFSLGDNSAANTALRASQQYGPYEGWLAKRRFKLALTLGDGLDSVGKAAFDADIGALLQSRNGRAFIAAYYAARPSLRDKIIAIAESLDDRSKSDFLNKIKSSLKKRAGRA